VEAFSGEEGRGPEGATSLTRTLQNILWQLMERGRVEGQAELEEVGNSATRVWSSSARIGEEIGYSATGSSLGGIGEKIGNSVTGA
jgi:hypothetical protein